MGAQAVQASAALRLFAQSLLAFAQQQETIRHDFTYAQRLGLDSHVRTQPAWSEIEIQWDVAAQPLRALVQHAGGLHQLLEQQQWWREEPYATVLHDLQDVTERLTQMLSWLDRIVFAPPTNHKEVVTWLEVNESANDATLVAAPLYVHETLEKELVHRKRCAIFTGATLRTGSGFSFIRDRLGLWDVNASTVESPFDYRRNTLLYLPSDIPEPNQSHYQQAVEQAIVKAAVASAGATLALFTSYAQLRATAEAIRAPLDRMGITVLQHGASSRQRLLREYRAADRAVLLGTRSFWEGIDLPGDELRCLLIVRLPFAVPSDPLVASAQRRARQPLPRLHPARCHHPLSPGVRPSDPARRRSRRGGHSGQSRLAQGIWPRLSRVTSGMYNAPCAACQPARRNRTVVRKCAGRVGHSFVIDALCP